MRYAKSHFSARRSSEGCRPQRDQPTGVARLKELEERRAQIDEQLRNLQPIPGLAPEVIENRLAEWRRLLRSSTTQGGAACFSAS